MTDKHTPPLTGKLEDWRVVPEQPTSAAGQIAIPGMEDNERERAYRDRVGKRGRRGEDRGQLHLF